MSQDWEANLALFIDFDNVALGARDARQRFDIKLLLQRILEKGKVVVKRAYADWHYYKEYMTPLHEAAIELIEIPMPRISGKNSADIRLVVDAIDLCYSKEHINTFVIVSGDSDFSPLVSKLRENNKRVIGVGVKNSTSNLLVGNCDEFIFYDDIYKQAVGRVSRTATDVPGEKRELFDFLLTTTQGLLQESRGVLYSSLIKDTMTRKQPDFNERAYGYSTFGDLLDEARKLGLLIVERDARAGGTWVVQGLGKSTGGTASTGGDKSGDATGEPAASPTKSSRRRRRSGSRGRGGGDAKQTDANASAADGQGAEPAAGSAPAPDPATPDAKPDTRAGGKGDTKPRSRGGAKAPSQGPPPGNEARPRDDGKPREDVKPGRSRGRRGGRRTQRTSEESVVGKPTGKPASKPPIADALAPKEGNAPTAAPAAASDSRSETPKGAKKATKKAPAKKTATKKAPAKKTASKKATTKKAPAKKATTKKATTKKAATKKAPAKKATTKKTTTKKAPAKKTTTKKAPAK